MKSDELFLFGLAAGALYILYKPLQQTGAGIAQATQGTGAAVSSIAGETAETFKSVTDLFQSIIAPTTSFFNTALARMTEEKIITDVVEPRGQAGASVTIEGIAFERQQIAQEYATGTISLAEANRGYAILDNIEAQLKAQGVTYSMDTGISQQAQADIKAQKEAQIEADKSARNQLRGTEAFILSESATAAGSINKEAFNKAFDEVIKQAAREQQATSSLKSSLKSARTGDTIKSSAGSYSVIKKIGQGGLIRKI